MRVLFWCDMEGVAGIQAWEQVNGGAPLYQEGRRLFTGEVNAAVRGAKAGGPPRSWCSTATARVAAGTLRA